jgi:dTDP-4-dehydrorhamnose reductase
MSRLRIAVTGSHGQVARSLREQSDSAGVDVITLGRPVLDLAHPGTIDTTLVSGIADVLVNAAAYTDVNKAESEPDVADCVNGQAAGLLAARARRLGIPIIHLSTDYVFDGEKAEPYREDDPLNPLSAYGQSKARGEQAVAAAHPQHVILRTSWIYSPFGRNFVRTMLDLAGRQPGIRVVSDQVGNPTAAADIAAATFSVARQLIEGSGGQRYGTFHLSATGTASWAEFATAIFRASADRGGPSASVIPISTAEYPTPAKRPRNSRLDCTKIANTYGITLPDWRTSLSPCINRILESGA